MEDQILCLHNLMLSHCCQLSNATCNLCIWSVTDRIVPLASAHENWEESLSINEATAMQKQYMGVEICSR